MRNYNSREFGNSHNTCEEPEMSQKEKIWKFLEVEKPEGLELVNDMLEDEATKIEFWDEQEVAKRTAMGPPFWSIDKAVMLSNPDKPEVKCVIAIGDVTEAECEGHYPEEPVVPTIAAVKIMSQSGLLLADYDKEPEIDAKGAKYAPEVKAEEGTQRDINTYIPAPATIIVEGSIASSDPKGKEPVIDLKAYDSKTGESVATTEGMKFQVISNRLRLRGLKRAKEQRNQ